MMNQYKLPKPECGASLPSSITKMEIVTSGEKSYDVPEPLDVVTVSDLNEKRTYEFTIDDDREQKISGSGIWKPVPLCIRHFARHVSKNTEANVVDSEGKKYSLRLDNVKRRPRLDEMTRLEDRIEEANYRREIGNGSFRAALYEVALRRYEESLRCVDYCHVLFHDSSALPSADREALLSLLNAAACHLKLKNYEDTIEFCNRALDLDRDNAKAHYRRGSAYFHSGQMDKAQKDLNRALELDPSVEKPVRKKLKSISKLERQRKAKMRKAFAGAFG